MNVMAQAHKAVKDAIKAQVELGNGRTHTYAQMLSLALKLAHKEFKAMQAQAKPLTVKLAVIGLSLAVEKTLLGLALKAQQQTPKVTRLLSVKVAHMLRKFKKMQNGISAHLTVLPISTCMLAAGTTRTIKNLSK